jgi:hypothetical protein
VKFLNKIEIAILTLKEINFCGSCTTGAEKEGGCATCKRKIAKDLAVYALQKQIPTKPIISSWCPAYCPSCNAELSESIGDGYYKHYKGKHVCDCGQLLKWD